VTLVLDASAAVELVMARPKRHAIAAVLQENDWVIAPSLYIYEVTNTMWKYHRLLKLELKDLQEKLQQAIVLIDEIIPAGDLYPETLRLSCQIDHTAYAAAYLAAAQKRKAAIVTLDQRLVSAAQRLGIQAEIS
jgi:predicted nucleic acid-binding protein